jgi:hypothetical protein
MLKLPKPKLSDMPVILKALQHNCSGAFLKNKAFMSAHETTSLSFRINGYADQLIRHLDAYGISPTRHGASQSFFFNVSSVHKKAYMELGIDRKHSRLDIVLWEESFGDKYTDAAVRETMRELKPLLGKCATAWIKWYSGR